MRDIGLDVHRDFCEVAIAEAGEVRSAGRIETTPEVLELFAQSLGCDDRVVLEVTGNAWEVARIIEPHVAKVIVVSPTDTGIRQARAKTDRLDARTLAKLLAAGSLEGIWMPDERTRALRRRLARRSQLVRARTRAKNEVHGALLRRLVTKPKVSDLFGVAGRRWLEALELPDEERETVDSALRQIDFLESELEEAERVIAKRRACVGRDPPADERSGRQRDYRGDVYGCDRRGVPLPFPAAAGRLSRPRPAGAPVGLWPSQARTDLKAGFGACPLRARRGRLERSPPAGALACLLRAHPRPARPPGRVVAAARKLSCLFWCLLTRQQDYAYAQPSLTKKKIRRLELAGGAPRGKVKPGLWAANTAMREAERELARQGELAYRRTVADWQAHSKGAGATPGRASQSRQSGKQRGRASVPDPAL